MKRMTDRSAIRALCRRARVIAAFAAVPIAALALASGCRDAHEAPATEPDTTRLGDAIVAFASDAVERAFALVDFEPGASLGEFRLTYYVMAQELPPEPPPTEPSEGIAEALSRLGDELDGELTEAPNTSDYGDAVSLYDDSCEPIAKVSREFSRDLRMQGSGVLRDGRIVSAGRRCDCDAGGMCFFVPAERFRWGIGAANRTLSPFRSVAVDTSLIPLSHTLYVPALEGLTMPGQPPWGGFVHDGCVIADDRGGAVRGRHLDFFAARHGYYRALLSRYGLTSVTVYDGTGRCDELGEGHRPAS